jgi:hypothetical protein
MWPKIYSNSFFRLFHRNKPWKLFNTYQAFLQLFSDWQPWFACSVHAAEMRGEHVIWHFYKDASDYTWHMTAQVSKQVRQQTFKTPFRALAFTISSNSPLLRSQSLSSPPRRLAQVCASLVTFVMGHVPNLSHPPSRFTGPLVITLLRGCLPLKNQLRVRSMTSSLSVAAAEAQRVRYVTPHI